MTHLKHHGFLSVVLEESFTMLSPTSEKVTDIVRIGMKQTVRGDQWFFSEHSLSENVTERICWNIRKLHKEGSYGRIYISQRMVVQLHPENTFRIDTEPHEVVIKEIIPSNSSSILSNEDVQSHAAEAFIHVMAWRAVQETATPWGIPRPYEVFGDYNPRLRGWKTMYLCMSFIKGYTLHSLFQKYWHPEAKLENNRLLIHVLSQVSYILYHLQQKIRLNHRDLKVNNIILHPRKYPFALSIGDYSFTTYYEITLIDFGFACIGCPPPGESVTIFQAGSWFPLGEVCCKSGRDIAQLLYCINCYFPFRRFLTYGFYLELRKLTKLQWNDREINLLDGVKEDGTPDEQTFLPARPQYTTGIYEFLRNDTISLDRCEPERIFQLCCSLLPAFT
jgi:serine/threonine protein kinase